MGSTDAQKNCSRHSEFCRHLSARLVQMDRADQLTGRIFIFQSQSQQAVF